MLLIITEGELILIAAKDVLYLYNTANEEYEDTRIPEPSLPSNLTKIHQELILKEKRNIISVCISKDRTRIAVCAENKQLLLFDRKLKVLQNCLTCRVASKVCFTPTNDVVVAEKNGDVYLYKFSEGYNSSELLLGHLSILLDVIVSDCGNYIVTCDRDEKIRVSRFPNSYNILSYCLGHNEFVTSVKFYGEIIVSSSGDGTVRFWELQSGHELHQIRVKESVETDEEKTAFEKFYNEMDSQDVEVSSLPVTHMQVLQKNDGLFIAVSLLYCNSIQVYFVRKDNNEICSKFLGNISFDKKILTFSLGNKLYILTDTGFYVCELSEEGIGETSPCLYLSKIYDDVRNLTNCFDSIANDVSVLYKRKYDNVQEYLERKKMRLESK